MGLYLELKIWDGRSMHHKGTLEILRDAGDDFDSPAGNYNVYRSNHGDPIGRIEGFDRDRGAWELAAEAIKLNQQVPEDLG